MIVGCRRKMSDDFFSLACLKISLTHSTARHKELRPRDKGQAMFLAAHSHHI